MIPLRFFGVSQEIKIESAVRAAALMAAGASGTSSSVWQKSG